MSVQPTSSNNPTLNVNIPKHSVWLQRLSKVTCLSTLFLIFVGGMVTSTGSGLAVPDWPLSYGSLFPPMVGGVFYEHGHRMVASVVGFFMLCLAVLLKFQEPRRWVRWLGYAALCAVIVQGILGGLTVLFFLPTPISVSHGVLAQTFFVMTIILAYSQSKERRERLNHAIGPISSRMIRANMVLIILVYFQLIVAAVMRHTHSGLAIPDFPQMGGFWWPPFNEMMLTRINDWRFDMNLDPVTINQVAVHFLHRAGAAVIGFFVIWMTLYFFRIRQENNKAFSTLCWLNALIIVQILLGIMAVLTTKAPRLTSLHVANGAAVLGMTVLLLLRTAPLQWNAFRKQL